MPETTVHKDHRVPLPEDDVRRPGEISLAKTEPEAPSMEGPPEHQLRLRVATSDARHNLRAGLTVHDVHHAETYSAKCGGLDMVTVVRHPVFP